MAQSNDLFEIIEEIDQERFLKIWTHEEETSGHDDGFTHSRMKELQDCKKLNCYVVRLTEIGFDNLILSPHFHPDWKVNEPGERYGDVISKYIIWRSQGQHDSCFQQIENVWRFISFQLTQFGTLFESEFILGRIFNNTNTALPEFYRNAAISGLHTVNFHRFVAYGLWCSEHGFQPVKAYYFT